VSAHVGKMVSGAGSESSGRALVCMEIFIFNGVVFGSFIWIARTPQVAYKGECQPTRVKTETKEYDDLQGERQYCHKLPSK
jgi:hypothetical protein